MTDYPRDIIDFSRLDELLRQRPPPQPAQAPAAAAGTTGEQATAPKQAEEAGGKLDLDAPAGGTSADEATAGRSRAEPRRPDHAHVVVLGNEKGGSGKSTVAIHVAVALMRDGNPVGTIDLDGGQWTLTRYLANRNATIKRTGERVPLPEHFFLSSSRLATPAECEADERHRFAAIMEKLAFGNRFVVVDCAGSDTHLARLAHSYADTLITPLNDSFVDLDVIAQIDAATMSVTRPSVYAELVWEARKRRAKRDGGSIDWIVMRNRLSSLDARNKRDMAGVLEQLGKRIGFRLAPGFGERVIFRELFLKGFTLLDLGEGDGGLSLSHVAARQEVRALLQAVRLPVAHLRVAAG